MATARDQVTTLQRASREAQAAHEETLAAAEARHSAHGRRWLGELDEQRQALKRARDELNQQRKTAARREAELADMLAATRKEAQGLAGALADVQAERARLVSQVEGGQETAHAIQNGLQQRNVDLQNRLGELREQIRIKDTQITALTGQLTMRRTARRKNSGA